MWLPGTMRGPFLDTNDSRAMRLGESHCTPPSHEIPFCAIAAPTHRIAQKDRLRLWPPHQKDELCASTVAFAGTNLL